MTNYNYDLKPNKNKNQSALFLIQIKPTVAMLSCA